MIFTDETSIMLGSIEGLINQRALRNTLAAHKGVITKQVKAQAWDDYATLLLSLVEEKAPAREDYTQKGSLEATIREYLEKKGIMSNMEHAFTMQRPFRKDGKVYLFSTDLRMWTKLHADPLSKKELAITASSLGIETKPLKFSRGEDKPLTTRTVYDVTRFACSIDGENEKPGLYEIEPGPEIEAVQ